MLSTPSGLRSAGSLPKSHEALRTTAKIDESNYFVEASNGVVVGTILFIPLTYRLSDSLSEHILSPFSHNVTNTPPPYPVYNKATKTITQYPSIQHLLLENDHASSSSWSFTLQPDGDASQPPEITQLVSYETGFAALSSTGQVFTWGDERYSTCLGRETTDETYVSHRIPSHPMERNHLLSLKRRYCRR